MNKIINYKYLPFLIPALGCIAMVLQFFTMGTMDEKGLVTSGHFTYVIAWGIALIAELLIYLCVGKLKGSNRYRSNFPASLSGAVGSFFAAAGIGISLMFYAPASDVLVVLWKIFGVLSMLSMLFTGICRMNGRKPEFFFHSIICLFFALHLVCCCRLWSSETQIERYGFALIASIGLMLSSYYHSAFNVGIGTRRIHIATGLTTCFFCLAAVPGADTPFIYLTGAVWAVTNLCVLTPPKRRPRPEPAPES